MDDGSILFLRIPESYAFSTITVHCSYILHSISTSSLQRHFDSSHRPVSLKEQFFNSVSEDILKQTIRSYTVPFQHQMI